MSRRRLGLRKRLALNIFSDLYSSAVAEHRLDTLFWECTLRCNLSCRHCGSDCRVDPGVRDMPIEDFLKVLDEEVTPHVDPAQVLVIFSGGEVLVRPDLERAGAEVTRRGYAWGMVTNGLGLTESRFRSLLDAGLRTVSVSLDGFEREHNYIRCNPLSYERALGALRMIVREPSLACDVVTCVTGAMVPRLGDFCGMLVAEGLKHWRLFSIFPMGRAKDDPSLRTTDEQFRAMLEFIRQTRREGRIDVSYACEGFLGGYETEVRDHFYQCAAGVSVASIRVDGAISGCTSIRANFNQGNIYRDNSGTCGKTASNPSATASGRGAANAPPARCSATASAAVCTCTATTAGCSIATITGFDAYPFLKKGPPSVGGCFFLGCPFPCRLLPRRFRSQLFRSRLLFLGCPSLVGSSSGLGSSFLVGSDLSYSDLDGSSSDVLSSAAFTRGIAGAPVPVPVYSGRSPSNASPSSNSLVL